MVDTPRGNAASISSLATYGGGYNSNIQVNYRASLGINRGSGADWFGPQNPQAPSAPPEVAGRAFNYMPGFNLQTQPRATEAVNFATMRALGDGYDLMRLVIETRKDQITKSRWKIRAKPDADPTTKDLTTPEQQARIGILTSFFERPDGVNKWRPWLRSLLEDVFVIDAPTLYKRRNRGGVLIGLEQLDGATIKCVIDDWGRTPQPYWLGGEIFYPPAYQQNLGGLAAVNYSVRDVLYRPFNRRVHKVYGYSPVEQVMTTVNIAIRRQQFQLGYYTEGNIPEALIGTPDGWTPDQIVAFQNAWDAMFTGNLAQRRHAKFVPGGVAKTFIPTKEPDLKNPMDDWLARIVCFAFSVSPQQLVTMMNRATAQSADTQSKEDGTEVLKEYIKEIIDDVIETEFQSPDLELAWHDETVVDELKQTEIVKAKVQAGLISVNRGREIIGEESSKDPGAEELMVLTGSGMVPIGANTTDGKKAAIDAGLAPDPTKLPPPGSSFGGKPGQDDGDDPKPPGKPTPPKPGAGKTPPAKAEKIARAQAVRGVFKASGVIEPVPFAFTAKQERKVAKLLAGALSKVAAAVAKQVRAATFEKAAGKTPQDIADDADLSAFIDMVEGVADELGSAGGKVATETLARIGVKKGDDLVDVVNERAVAKARDIAAEMVGMRWNDDGELVPSNSAQWRIDETTRDMIRDTIAKGLEDNIGNEEIADLIESSTGFSEDRADLIAHTEIARVNSESAVEAYTGARDELGLSIKKEWLLGENPCDVCQGNADEGAIDLDDEFPSGDSNPPAHPNCECAVSPVMVDETDE